MRSAGRCGWHLPRRDALTGRRRGRPCPCCPGRPSATCRPCPWPALQLGLVPAAFDVAADARARRDGWRVPALTSPISTAEGSSSTRSADSFDIAFQFAGHGHAPGAHAAVEAGAAVDAQVALDVDVTLEPAGDADVAAAGNLALDGEVGGDHRLARLRGRCGGAALACAWKGGASGSARSRRRLSAASRRCILANKGGGGVFLGGTLGEDGQRVCVLAGVGEQGDCRP